MKKSFRPVRFLLLILAVALFGMTACNKVTPPKKPMEGEQKKIIKNKGRLVGDLASPSNMAAAKIEGVCLVEGLPDTGADEPPTTYPTMVLQELQKDPDKKKTARQRIASLSTAVVLLKTIVPPGARKGDRLDVEVKLPPESQATSIEGGWVENARLHEYLATDRIHVGSLNGVVSGHVLLDPTLIERESPVARKEGTIIGGAVVVRPRNIWLSIREDERSVGVAQRIEDVINKRFSYKLNGSKRKIAEAKAGAARIDLIVPDEYRENINRFANVVLCVSFFETPDELQRRIEELHVKLHQPGTAEFASLQLEAIGPNNALCVSALRSGLESPDVVVRYHSAVAMAYLNISEDRDRTARILAELGRDNATLRPSCLAVLGTCLKTSMEADKALRELLVVNSNETRYGAFRALWSRNPKDYMIQGEDLGGRFSYHALNCGGTSIVHVTKTKRAEIVLFAKNNLFLQGDFELEAGNQIVVRNQGNEVVVKHYKSGLDEQRITDRSLDAIIRAIVEVGGNYPEVVSFLVNSKKKNSLVTVVEGQTNPATLVFDALPGASNAAFKRIYDLERIMEEEEMAAAEKEKKSGWSKMNPAHWFSKEKNKEEEENFAGTFSDTPEDSVSDAASDEKADVKSDKNVKSDKKE